MYLHIVSPLLLLLLLLLEGVGRRGPADWGAVGAPLVACKALVLAGAVHDVCTLVGWVHRQLHQ